MRSKGAKITISNLEEAMTQVWRQTDRADVENGNGKTETTLAAFSGKCYKCGQVGHCAKDYPNKGNHLILN